MSNGHGGGIAGAHLSDRRLDGWSVDLVPPAPDTDPGPPPSAVGALAPDEDSIVDRFYPGFERRQRTRLARGAVEYGDMSFDRNPSDLIEEQIEEAVDTMTWVFPIYVRLVRMKEKALAMEERLSRLGIE